MPSGDGTIAEAPGEQAADGDEPTDRASEYGQGEDSSNSSSNSSTSQEEIAQGNEVQLTVAEDGRRKATREQQRNIFRRGRTAARQSWREVSRTPERGREETEFEEEPAAIYRCTQALDGETLTN